MPAPAVEFASSGVHALQPSDSWIEDGVNPNAPWPAKYVNWFLGYLQSTLFGAEHDPLTGAHALTAEPAISGVEQTVWLPLTPGGWYDGNLNSPTFSSATTPSSDSPVLQMVLATSADLYYVINEAVASIREDCTITGIEVYANLVSGTLTTLNVEIEQRDNKSDRVYGTLGVFSSPSGSVGGGASTNPPGHLSYNGSVATDRTADGDTRIRINIASGAATVLDIYGIAIKYTPSKLVAG